MFNFLSQVFSWSFKPRLCFWDAFVVFLISKTIWTESWESIEIPTLIGIIVMLLIILWYCLVPSKYESQSPMG